ncbi:MAG: hypothetical protein ACMG6S_12400, partial [Byssovorax sp.]
GRPDEIFASAGFPGRFEVPVAWPRTNRDRAGPGDWGPSERPRGKRTRRWSQARAERPRR